jgi:hypothetical protein
MRVGQTLLVLVGVVFFFFGTCNGQVEVIHFNSEWNSKNNFDISTLKDCEKQNIIICDNPDMQEKHEIVSVPTIIIFDEGEEIKRFQANIMMKLEATEKEIQQEINEIYLAKFE